MRRYTVTAFYADRMGFLTFDPAATFSVSLSYDIAEVSPEAAAEEVWRRLNADDRPNRRMQRSMCVGDAVQVIEHDSGEVEWLGVASVGFQPVPMLTNFADETSEWAAGVRA
jgi:hypothetical protein